PPVFCLPVSRQSASPFPLGNNLKEDMCSNRLFSQYEIILPFSSPGRVCGMICIIAQFLLDFASPFSLSTYFHDKLYFTYNQLQLLFLFWLGLPAEFFFH
ncbi:MAG: hypothetical protein WAR22_09365, partial [Desulfomonilia bacterium]